MANKIEHLKARAEKLQGQIWDLEYEIEYHKTCEEPLLKHEELAGKTPMLNINGTPVSMRNWLDNTIKLKQIKLEDLKREYKFLADYILQEEGL